MNTKINITEAEWPIMETLWPRPTATAAEITAGTALRRQVSERTVKTLIRRLIAKGAIGYEVDQRDSRVYHYRALIPREEAVQKKNMSFLGQLYGNSVSGMLSYFIEHSDLNQDEIERLKAILDQKEKERS